MLKTDLDELLTGIAKQGISEYHLTPGAKAFFRVNGFIQEDDKSQVITQDYMESLLKLILSEEGINQLYTSGRYEMAYPIKGVGRFRMRFGQQRSSITLVILIKSTTIPSVEALKIPRSVVEVMYKTSGLLIVTGETKSNKSTTIAALLKHIAQAKSRIITTIENPVEYLIPHGKGIVNQVEVGVDIQSVEEGLNESMKNHVDIIYVNDLSTKVEWKLVFDALEKGFFVILSMNSSSVEAAIEHLLFNFTRDEHPFIKRLMANHLNAFLCEVNLKTTGDGFIPLYEVLLNNKAVHNMFLENKLDQLREIFKAFPNTDMCSLNMAMVKAIETNQIDKEYALNKSNDHTELIKLLNGVKS